MRIDTLMPGAEPFFFRGGPVGCLLLHGFTASPQEMRGLGEHLAAQGYTVYGPRFTHHGTDPADMLRSHWRDWYFTALDGWHVLRAQCDQVVVIGISMGAATALLLAAQQPVAAVVSLSTAIILSPDWRLRIARLLWRLHPYLPKEESDSLDPAFWVGRYRVRPLRAVFELMDYAQVVEATLPQITAPTLLMHSQTDTLTSPENVELVYNGISSAHKEKIWIEQSDHVITLDAEKETVFAHVAAFVQARTAPETTIEP